jgi:hypothetical protein
MPELWFVMWRAAAGSWISAKIKKNKFKASNTLLNRAECCITRKEYFTFLSKNLATVMYPKYPKCILSS